MEYEVILADAAKSPVERPPKAKAVRFREENVFQDASIGKAGTPGKQRGFQITYFCGACQDSVSDVEDAVQEVFLRLLESLAAFRDAGHAKAWLIRTSLHRASDIRRRAEKRNIPLEEAAQRAAPAPGGELLRAVRALPEKYGAVIHLHYYYF